jgi:hypothetical protein
VASLAQYLDVDGYVLHITTALATDYTEGSETFSIGSQDDSAVPGTATATGIASHYAIVDVGGEALVEAGALAARQPIKSGFAFTVEAFETGPKLVPEGAYSDAGAVGRVRRRKKQAERVEPLKLLSDAVEAALTPPAPEPVVIEAPAPEPEPITVDDDAAVIAARAKITEAIAETQAKANAEVTAMRAAFEAAQQRKAEAEAQRRERVAKAEREAAVLAKHVEAAANDDDDVAAAMNALMAVLDWDEDDEERAA